MACPIESVANILVIEPYHLPESAEGVISCTQIVRIQLSDAF
jgi:hypothetical protein